MALSTPQAPPADARTLEDSVCVASLLAPGYCVRARAQDLASADGVAVALVHSTYALAKLADGRFLAARAARETGDGCIELGLSHTGSSRDMHDPRSGWGSVELGIQHVAVELEAEAGSSRLRSTRRTIPQWLEEATWRPTLRLLTSGALQSDAVAAQRDGGAGTVESEVILVQLTSLKVLRQALQLVGMVEKGVRQWDASGAGSFIEAALGSRPVGTAAVTSAAVRLNSKVELSARRRRAFAAAVGACAGSAVDELW
ncbi:MAG: hypothetical protein SGPRY_003174 [Prymnesium sp.]